MAIIGPTVTTRNVRGTTVRLVGSEPQTVSSGVAVDIDGVVTLIASALADYQRRLGVAPAKTLTLREAYPKDPVENPGTSIHQVFYRLRRRQLGNMGNDNDRRPWRPRPVQSTNHPEDPTLTLDVLAQWMDNELEFEVTSPFAGEADRAALFFERFMVAYRWYFIDMGIDSLRYIERTEDRMKKIGGTELYCRPIYYLVRTQLISQEVAKKIGEVIIDYDIGPALHTTVIDEETETKDIRVDHVQGS